MLDFLFPEIPEWKETHKLIQSGILGKILNINVNWKFLSYDLKNNITSWKTNVKEGGGALSFYFSHVFYYLENFLGPIKNIDCNFSFSKKSINKGETGIQMSLLFENGCIGKINVDISYIDQQKHVIEIIGENSSIFLENNTNSFVDGFELYVSKSEKTQEIMPETLLDTSFDKTEDPRVKVILPLANRFINWCNYGVKTKPDFQDGLRVQELIEKTRSLIQNN